MDVNGTATISLADFSRLQKAATRGVRLTNLHQPLLQNLSSFLTAVIYNENIPDEVATQMIGELKTFAKSTEGIKFYSGNNRIMVTTDDQDMQN